MLPKADAILVPTGDAVVTITVGLAFRNSLHISIPLMVRMWPVWGVAFDTANHALRLLCSVYVVTAPVLALLTELAYLAKTPRL